MREFAKFCRVLMWIVLAVGVLFQSVSIAGIEYQQERGKELMKATNDINTFWLGLVMVAMVVAVVLFVTLKKGKIFPFILAIMAAIGVVIVAYYIDFEINGPAMSGVETFANSPYVLTKWEIIYRNALLSIVPLLMIPMFLVYLEDRREAKYAEEHEEAPSILDGMGDFRLSKLSEADERPEDDVKKRR